VERIRCGDSVEVSRGLADLSTTAPCEERDSSECRQQTTAPATEKKSSHHGYTSARTVELVRGGRKSRQTAVFVTVQPETLVARPRRATPALQIGRSV
jgi:hypothetical protein